MCLGIPGQVVELVDGYAGQLALVDVEGARRRVNVGMLDELPGTGDWVLLHMGFAMEIIDRATAREALSGLELMGRARTDRIRRRFEVSGVVQGVGFRPFVYVTASALGLAGSVANTSAGVVAEVEGEAESVAEFGRRLRADAPPLAVVETVEESGRPTCGGTEFTIEDSRAGEQARTLVSPDVATCQACLEELRDPADRRHRHPFLTCTHCGPRFTIVTGTPYDRAATTMAPFAMCEACRAEYENPADRRFHAQPVACHDCGPRLELVVADGMDSGGGGGGAGGAGGVTAREGEEALRAARELLAAGRIVAVKGLGGYHLACDAGNAGAVAALRRRKQRGGKPFAVMARDRDTAAELVTLTGAEEELLTSARRPIVLLRRRTEAPIGQGPGGGVADAVAPGNPDLGVMLPYTPLHVLLFGTDDDPPGPDVLVMTSGNLSGEPIVTDDAAALKALAPLADAWLRHDREIQVPCDDSVSRFVAGAELPLRRSRGHAPLPLALPFDVPPMLAVGADLKNTCALAEGRYAWLSQHIGDMDDLATVEALARTERQLEHLTGVRPAQLVADAHPGYRSSEWARAQAAGRPVRAVQHHHAHIASVMGEHGVDADERVIGIAFDGTGHGSDGAVWGGEVLVGGYKAFRRAAHLGYVQLAGGDASVLRPYRMALAHLRAAGVDWDAALPPVSACPERERGVLAHQLQTGFGCVPTSSMGRLFDAVASLAGIRHAVDYEAEAAVELEGLARAAGVGQPEAGYAFGLPAAQKRETRGVGARGKGPGPDGRAPGVPDQGPVPAPVDPGPVVADPGPVIRAVVDDVRAGVPKELIAARFHAAVVALVGSLAERCREDSGLETVALGGGVFQNAVLLEAVQHTLADRGFRVLRPRLLPPNDGGIALGQLLIAASG